MPQYKPQKIFIDQSVENELLTQRVINRFPKLEVETIDESFCFEHLPAEVNESITKGKKLLFLLPQKARFLRQCPQTRNYICCNYHILNLANQCDLECSYCVLQDYLTKPFMIYYANTDDMLAELRTEFESKPDQIFRVGTGQLTDSLSMDDITAYSTILIPFFAGQRNAILELKTKSTKIENLYDLEHNRRTVVSWTLNAASMARSEELRAATIDERIEAAAKCQALGYLIGFHFDPLINHEGWEQGYREVVSRIFDLIDPNNIAWISLGALRFMPKLKRTILSRFTKSKIVFNEFVPGLDGKLRYFKPIRVEMFARMVEWLRAFDESIPIYLCMESQEIWEKVLGWRPRDDFEVGKFLDNRIRSLSLNSLVRT